MTPRYVILDSAALLITGLWITLAGVVLLLVGGAALEELRRRSRDDEEVGR